MSDQLHPNEHLEEADVAAYVDGMVDARRRRRIEAHLASCDDCRGEMLEVRRVVRGTGSRAPSGFRLTLLAAAAAGLVLIPTFLFFTRADTPVLRDGPSEGDPHIRVVSPAEGTSVRPEDLTFAWGAAGPDATYRLTLLDPEGVPLWTRTITDSTYTPTPEERLALRSGSTYFWFVDALFEGGRTATTGTSQFSLPP